MQVKTRVKSTLKYSNLLVCLVIFFVWATLTHAANPPLSLDEYWQKVEQTQTLVKNLGQASSEADYTQLSQLADEWQQITQVELPDGTLLAVDHSFLAAQLRANPPDLNRLESLLTALLTASENWPAARHTPSDLQALESILARPEFQWRPAQPSLLGLLWQKFWEYIWKLLAPWLPEEAVISLDGDIFTLLRYILTGLVVIILVVVLAFTFWQLADTFVADTEIRGDLGAAGEVLSAEAALKRAQELSGAGDYRTAVRYLYLSSLLILDERGLLRYDRSKTNREYLRSVAHAPKLAGGLRAVIDVFDRVWYGYQPLDQDTYRQYTAEVDKLRQQK